MKPPVIFRAFIVLLPTFFPPISALAAGTAGSSIWTDTAIPPAGVTSATTLTGADFLKPGSSATLAGESVLYLDRADRVEYLDREKKVYLTGNVKIRFEDNTVTADDIKLDLEKNTIEGSGHLIWEGAEHKATGSRMTYDIKSKVGWVEDVTLTTAAWICKGRRVDQSGEESINIEPGVITTCDAPKPHWHIYSKKIQIRLKKDLTAYQVTIYAGSTPVLWLPVLSTPLRDFRLPFEAEVGRSGELGPYVRTSPSFSLSPRFPSQAHIDFFTNKGWGYGLTQSIEGNDGQRVARFHGYRIAERGTPPPGIPRVRWETFGDASFHADQATNVAVRADYVSDAEFRQLYGGSSLPVSTASGERHLSGLVSRRVPGAVVSVLGERTELRRVGFDGQARYITSEIYAPKVSVSSEPATLAPWLSGSLRMDAERHYMWQNSWWYNQAMMTPSLEAFTRMPVLGSLTVNPGLHGAWRDRGSRILLLDSTAFREDVNKGFLWSGDNQTVLRTPLPLGLEAETSHNISQRFNKIGYDPFGYHGLDSHRIMERLSASFDYGFSASVRSGYDLRNKQDEILRRWMPITPEAAFAPTPFFSISSDADYDIFYHRWRRASGTLGLGVRDKGAWIRIMPSYLDNRLALSQLEQTSMDYRLSRYLYADSFQSAALFPELFYTNVELSFPLTPLTRAYASGQYDYQYKRVSFYTVGLVRNLHCWDMEAAFHHYMTGEYRFDASLHLMAFPREKLPLISL